MYRYLFYVFQLVLINLNLSGAVSLQVDSQVRKTISESTNESLPKLLFIGNSIMIPIYELFVADNEPYECTNIAVSGAGTNSQLDAWNAMTSLQKESFDYILLEVGINGIDDAALWYVYYYQDLVNAIRAGKKESCLIIAATLTPAKGSGSVNLENWLKLNAAIRGEGDHPITGIDIVMTTNTSRLDQDGDYALDAVYDRGDHLHPNSQGQLIIKNNFLEVLRENPIDPTDPTDTTAVLKVPLAPSALESKDIAQNSISLFWTDNSDNEDTFIVLRYPISNPDDTSIMIVDRNNTLFIDNTVKSGTSYVYSVKAVNDAGSSAFSPYVLVTIPSAAETSRIKEGLIVYYNFGYNPDFVIYDLSGNGVPLNLYTEDSSSLSWNEHKLTFKDPGLFISSSAATKIVDQLTSTNELTVECWIKPEEPEYFGSGRILSFNENEDIVGFVLEQNYFSDASSKSLNYNIRLSTSSTVSAGFPSLVQQENSLTHISLHHICYVRESSGHEVLYVDNKMTTEGFRPGDLNSWNPAFKMYLGNNINKSLPWKGSVYMIAIYNKAFTKEDVTKHYNANPLDTAISSRNMKYLISLNPNPCQNFATVKIIPREVSDVFLSSAFLCLIDTYGNVLLREEIFNPIKGIEKTLDLSRYPSGFYYLQVISGTEQQALKIIKN